MTTLYYTFTVLDLLTIAGDQLHMQTSLIFGEYMFAVFKWLRFYMQLTELLTSITHFPHLLNKWEFIVFHLYLLSYFYFLLFRIKYRELRFICLCYNHLFFMSPCRHWVMLIKEEIMIIMATLLHKSVLHPSNQTLAFLLKNSSVVLVSKVLVATNKAHQCLTSI